MVHRKANRNEMQDHGELVVIGMACDGHGGIAFDRHWSWVRRIHANRFFHDVDSIGREDLVHLLVEIWLTSL